MSLKKTVGLVIIGLTLLSGCSTTTTRAPKTIIKHQTSIVDHRTTADQDAWSAARAVSRANAASAKKLAKQTTVLAKASSEANSQSSDLADQRESVKAASQAAADSASKTAASQAKQASKNAKAASESTAETQTSSAKQTTEHANRFSGNTDTAQQGVIIGNKRSKIYHVYSQHNYRMAGKNVETFNTEAEAQAAGYRKSLR
ncbi:sunset domain-containing protein [Lactiplantibacillus songbeiensis]|uniref:Cell surface protein n=1 Tax=Lactiplantibacillus songbeiensis TaxID=2559920 RepID=A0ABW4C1D4_9LACO|nr:cell surface protein [Lactiplantibacillus songbeiensis]